MWLALLRAGPIELHLFGKKAAVLLKVVSSVWQGQSLAAVLLCPFFLIAFCLAGCWVEVAEAQRNLPTETRGEVK